MRRSSRLALLVLPSFVLPLAGTAYAADPPTCAYADGRVTITGFVPGVDPVVLDRLPTGEIRLGGVQCGTATVTNTDLVAVSSSGPIALDLTLPFGPGLTPETDGISEIEMTWRSGPLYVWGGPGPDDLRQSGQGGVHLNGDTDPDVTWTPNTVVAVLQGNGGADVIDASPAQGQTLVGSSQAEGGSGDDVLRGSQGRDRIDAGYGDDVVVDGPGNDLVRADFGDDLLLQAVPVHVPGAGLTVPDLGSAQSTVEVQPIGRAADVELRLTLVHPDTSSLLVTLTNGTRATALAVGQPGTGFHGTLFDEDAPDGIESSAGTHTGRFRPVTGIESLLLDDPAGPWTLTVTDRAADGQAATVVGWTLHLVGETGPGATDDDNIDGGPGVDTLSYELRTAPVSFLGGGAGQSGTSGGAGERDLFGNIDGMTGGSGDDTIVGSGFPETIRGGPGADRLRGGPFGGDVLDCGPSAGDVADYGDMTSGVTIDLETGVVVAQGTDERLTGCEKVYGSGADDVILGTGGVDDVDGGLGNDVVDGRGGADVLAGGFGDDVVSGGAGDDRVSGGYGNDVLTESDAGNGADVLSGDSGQDTVTYLGRSAGITVTLDGAADDGAPGEGDLVDTERVVGTDHADVITGDAAANDLTGAGGDDVVDAGGGADWVYGGDGADVITGGAGDDTLYGQAGDDRFAEGAEASGADALSGGAGLDAADYAARTLPVSVDLDDVADDGGLGEGDDVRFDVEDVYGGSGADTLTGSWAPNRLYGFGGADVVTGGPNADLLDGGSGSDLLLARDLTADTVAGGSGLDVAETDDTDATSGIEVFRP